MERTPNENKLTLKEKAKIGLAVVGIGTGAVWFTYGAIEHSPADEPVHCNDPIDGSEEQPCDETDPTATLVKPDEESTTTTDTIIITTSTTEGTTSTTMPLSPPTTVRRPETPVSVRPPTPGEAAPRTE